MLDTNSTDGTPPATPPAGTDDGTPPAAAIPPAGDDGASNQDETVTLKKSDYQNLVSQRDRANNDNNSAFVQQLAQERVIDEFIKENSKDFPDLNRDDLMHVYDPDELKTEATRLQRRFEETVQKKLLDLNRADTPVMSADERAAELKKLEANPNKDSFGRYLELQMPTAART